MTPDTDLPVWTFRPNWAEPIVERLSWETDVLPSSYGPEQRRALRLSPRREFEIKFNPIDEARSYFELWLHRLGSNEFMVPLYHDAAKLTASVLAAAVILPMDTTYREFVSGGMAVIMGPDPFSCDVVQVTAVNPTNIHVTGVTRAWPKGSVVHPLRRTRVDQESAVAALTSHVGDAAIVFQLNQANDIPDEGAWGTLLNGYPILTDKPNRRENIDLQFERNSLILDNDHGLRELGDDAGRAFTIQSHMTMQQGRQQHWEFRQFLYRLRGQQGSIWVPTFNRDVTLSRIYVAGNGSLKIKNIGYAYTGGAISGRTFIRFTDGSVAQVDAVGAPPSATEESLTLHAPLAGTLQPGTTGSFMDTCRLASDDIEITHHTSTDGVSECNLSWRAFRDERTIPAPVSFAIPYAFKSVAACGTPADNACVDPATTDSGPDSGNTGGATDGTGDPSGLPFTPVSSTYCAAIWGFVPSDFNPDDPSDPHNSFSDPGDFAGKVHQNPELVYRSFITLSDLVGFFPELAGKTNASTPFTLPGGAGPPGVPFVPWNGLNHGQAWSYDGSWHYDPDHNDPAEWISAFFGGSPPYAEVREYWDEDETILKKIFGRGVAVEYVGGWTPAAALTPIVGNGNYTLWFCEYTQYFRPNP